MGIGLGVGYLTPVKNLMLWFAKGLATGIAVAGFGLAKAIAGSISVTLTGFERVGVRRIVRQPVGILRRLSYDGCGPPIQRADSDHHHTVRRRSRVHHRHDARHERQERQHIIITLNSNDISFNTLTRRKCPSTPYADVLGIRPQPVPRRGTDSGPVPRRTSSH